MTIKPLATLRWKKILRVPVANFSSARNLKRLWIKGGNTRDPAFLRKNAVPKTLNSAADACNRPDAGDDRASSAHVATLFSIVSTYAFMHRKVFLPML